VTRARGHTRTKDRTARGLLAVAALAGLLAFAGAAGAKPKPAPAGSLYYQLPPALRHWLGPQGRPGTATAMRVYRSRIVVGLAGGRTEVLRAAPGESQAHALARVREQAGVRFAEPDYVAHIADLAPPNDPRFGDQWGLGQVHALAGWQIYPGGYGVPLGTSPPIAILDTGVDGLHEDLAGGKVLSASGADCIASTTCKPLAGDATDLNGHGTYVAGIAGATAQNSLGGLGVAYASKLIPVKVCDDGGNCPVSQVALGIRWAADHGAKVVNLSLALAATSAPTVLCSAVTYAIGKGAVVVAAAGNAPGLDDMTTPFPYVAYPAGCPGAIGVGAVAPTNPPPPPGSGHEWPYGHPAWSNSGFPSVFVSAPGGGDYDGVAGDGVLSTLPLADGGPYGTMPQSTTGTSAASPFVSGIAALLLGQADTRTPADVRRVLAETAVKVGRDIPNGNGAPYGSVTGLANPFNACADCTWHPFYGYGEADVSAALTGVTPTLASVSPASAPIGGTLTLTGQDLSIVDTVGFAGGATAPVSAPPTSTKVTVKVPADAKSGALTVTTSTGLTSAPAGLVKIAPLISKLDPLAARVGETVTITGTTLDDSTNVLLHGLAMPVVTQTATQIVATVPEGATSGQITVKTFGGTATSAATFGVKPTVSSLTPNTGVAGTSVVIGGKTLVGVKSVQFTGPNGTLVSATPKTVSGSLTAAVPAGAISGPVTVANAGGASPSDVDFTVVPRATAIAPAAGFVGAAVTVTGTGFDSRAGHLTHVKVNGVELAGATVVSPLKITGSIAPGSTSGGVTATDGATGAPPFKVTPRIDQPGAAVQAGDDVTLTGTNLDDPGATLKLSSTSAVLPLTPVDSQHVKFTVPDAVSGKLTFSTQSGSSPAVNLLIVPTIDSISGGPFTAGSSITFTGATYSGTNAVLFTGLGGPVSSAFKIATNGKSVTATVPPTAVTGVVNVRNAGGPTPTDDPVAIVPKSVTISPSSGPVGTPVTITGTNFDGVATATVGGAPLTGVQHLSAMQLRGTIGAGAKTSGGSAIVTTAGGDSPAGPGFRVTPNVVQWPIPAAPVQVGDTIDVLGTNLRNDDGSDPVVTVGTTPADVQPGSTATDLKVTVPDTVSGKVSVSINSGTAAATFLTPSSLLIRPTVGSPFAPDHGASGQVVTIPGKTFASVKSVAFNGVIAPFTFTGGVLKATVPAASTTGKVTVTTASGSDTSAQDFVVDPKIATFSPASGPVGTLVTITGSGFGPGVKATFTGSADASPETGSFVTVLRVKVPAGAKSGPITVSSPPSTVTPQTGNFNVPPSVTSFDPGDLPAHGGSTVHVHGFNLDEVTSTGAKLGSLTVTLAHVTPTTADFVVPDTAVTAPLTLTSAAGTAVSAPLPVVAVVDPGPQSGQAGDKLTFTGKFAGITSVAFTGAGGADTVPAVFSVEPTQLKATIPAAALTGAVAIHTAGGAVSSGVVTVSPTVTSFSPLSAVAGSSTTITIKGTGFDPAATVAFGTSPGVNTHWDSATQMRAQVPNGATNGSVKVANPGGQVGLKSGFTVSFSVTGLSATLLPTDDVLTVNGVGFATSGMKVTFPGSAPVAAQSSTATSLKVKVPATAAGPDQLTVTKGTTSTKSVDQFARYWIAPTSGPTGTTVTVHGSGFSALSDVTFDGHEVPFSLGGPSPATVLTLVVPNGATSGLVAVGPVGLQFDVTLSVTGLDHSSGVAGDPVVISGVGFEDGATVSFGGTPATSVQVDSDTQITATVPDGASSGLVSVTTSTGTAQSAEVFEIDGGTAPGADDSPQFAGA
jgi:subtilisin family serine protease